MRLKMKLCRILRKIPNVRVVSSTSLYELSYRNKSTLRKSTFNTAEARLFERYSIIRMMLETSDCLNNVALARQHHSRIIAPFFPYHSNNQSLNNVRTMELLLYLYLTIHIYAECRRMDGSCDE